MRKPPACLHCSDPPVIAGKDNADWLLVGGGMFELAPQRLDHAVIKANEILSA